MLLIQNEGIYWKRPYLSFLQIRETDRSKGFATIS